MVEKFDTYQLKNIEMIDVIEKINEIIDYKSDVEELTMSFGEYFVEVHKLMDIKDKKIKAVQEQNFEDASNLRELEVKQLQFVSECDEKISEVLIRLKGKPNGEQ